MSAREIIEAALMRATHKPFGTAAVYEALTTHGYRLIPPGQLDRETIERCAAVAEQHRHFAGDPYADSVIAAIRALGAEK